MNGDVIRPVPQQRIIEKMNEYMSRRDYDGAQRHLLYWLEEAELGKDLRGQLMLRNELIGHFRKTSQKEPAMENAQKAIELITELGMEETISAGTTYVNAATAYNAFGEYDRSMEMFRRARAVYESSPHTEPQLVGGLYNNMALTCTALGRYEDALGLYERALSVMADVPDGELEQAITYLNMADTVEAQLGMEAGESRICELAERAEDLLEAKYRELAEYAEQSAHSSGAEASGDSGLAHSGSGTEHDNSGLAGSDSGTEHGDSGLASSGSGTEYSDSGTEHDDGGLAHSGGRAAAASLSRETRARLGYYAFVCEKCAPVFAYYGYFIAAERLKERADRLAGML